jgi:acyl-[acyl-carrier-protein] desaturase
MVFYRNLLGAAFDLDPDGAMQAVTDVVANFQMPGANIEGFGRKALSIALAGIYDLRQHRDEVLQPVLRQWNVFGRTDLKPEGEKAREELAAHLDELETQAARFEQHREARRLRLAARNG